MVDDKTKDSLSMWWITYGDEWVSWLDDGVAEELHHSFFGGYEGSQDGFKPREYLNAKYENVDGRWRFQINEYGKQLIRGDYGEN